MANQTGLQFTVKVGALSDNTFVVASFKLDEALNRPYPASSQSFSWDKNFYKLPKKFMGPSSFFQGEVAKVMSGLYIVKKHI
jgi:hypothetical protein